MTSSVPTATRPFLAATLIGLAATVLPPSASARQPGPPPALVEQVEVVRTTYGVPHVRAENLEAAGYGLAYVMMEDHGAPIAYGLLRARGEMGRWFGPDSMDGDFLAQREYRRAIEAYPLLEEATRAVYEGFAAGVNRYIELHPEEFPPDFRPHFTGYDIAARDVNLARASAAREFVSRRTSRNERRATDAGEGAREREEGEDPIEEGSNAWAFAPSRTRSGRAILLRNPHLSWTAGYYEAHVTVPGVLDFYGDFRVGGPFGVIGGFNRHLGWATTNNTTDLDEIYALEADPERVDHYLFGGASIPLRRELITVTFRNGAALSTETREFWYSPLGPVVHRDSGKVYVLRAAGDGEYRAGEQFLHMMRAQSLEEWQDAMRMRARMNSNFTYADGDGNIYYVWNAAIPALPHASGGDTAAVPASSTDQVWTRYVPYDSLPQLLNPRGGYVHNENDSPHYTNLNEIQHPDRYPAYFPEPSLRLRSQHSLELIHDTGKLSLEDVVRLKHSYRMLLADRVKDDLLAAVRATAATGDVAAAADLLERWDNTASPESRGSVLFDIWWRRYTDGERADSMFAQPWTPAEPTTTPRGLRDPRRAAEAFAWAVTETARRHGSYDVPWGEVHRVRIGDTDVPVGGCGGALGCFRVLNFRTDPDGKRSVTGGDGWVLAVEFTDVPRAYSVLAYGESSRPDSPLHGNQSAMFARGEMKPVAFTRRDIDARAMMRYRPGEHR